MYIRGSSESLHVRMAVTEHGHKTHRAWAGILQLLNNMQMPEQAR